MALIDKPADLSRRLRELPGPDADKITEARARQDTLLKPKGSLGRLEQLAVFMAGWSKLDEPYMEDVAALIFAGNHGVTAQGVSPYPREVTAKLVDVLGDTFASTAIQVLASEFDFDYRVTGIDLDQPTGDISLGPAMTVDETIDAINLGAAAVEELDDNLDLVLLGEVGIGNTTAAAALAARCCGGKGVDWAGPGTGLDQAGVALKARVVDRAIALHGRSAKSAFDVLMRLGGREQAAIAGATIAARQRGMPVMLDGFVVAASVAPLYLENPDVGAHCLVGHVSAEPGHRRLLAAMKLSPILDLGMALGECSGAALAIPILKAAVKLHTTMATFEDVGLAAKPDSGNS